MGSPMGLPAMSRNLSGVLGPAVASSVLPGRCNTSSVGDTFIITGGAMRAAAHGSLSQDGQAGSG